MTDREKVIKGLECCNAGTMCDECDYHISQFCLHELKADALTLLEEVEPIKKDDMYFCGWCKNALAKTWRFCPKCGKAVKWND